MKFKHITVGRMIKILSKRDPKGKIWLQCKHRKTPYLMTECYDKDKKPRS